MCVCVERAGGLVVSQEGQCVMNTKLSKGLISGSNPYHSCHTHRITHVTPLTQTTSHTSHLYYITQRLLVQFSLLLQGLDQAL